MTPFYAKLTWEEVGAANKDRVIILPVGATEDHGPHMALDTDTLLVGSIAEGVARDAPDEVFVLPTIPFGFNEHHKDFPGVIWIEPATLVAFVTDVTKSLAHHGFRRMLILNGHGSNHPVLDLAARQTVIATEAICVFASYWNLMADTINAHRVSPPGGIAHACEFEASLYLHLDPDNIHLQRASARVVHDPQSRYFNLDLAGRNRAMLMRWWSQQSPDGTMGDPTVATAERGKLFYDAAVRETIGLVREIRGLPWIGRRDHH